MKANVNSLKILENIPILNKKKTNKQKINELIKIYFSIYYTRDLT